MPFSISTEVIVSRKVRDGWFVYTCDELPGLYVAHQDDRVAYNNLPEAIRLLVKLDEGIDCAVSHAVSYSEFVQRARLSVRATEELRNRTNDLVAAHTDHIRFVLQPDGSHHTGQ